MKDVKEMLLEGWCKDCNDDYHECMKDGICHGELELLKRKQKETKKENENEGTV